MDEDALIAVLREYEVVYGDGRAGTKHETQAEALDEFREAVANGVPVDVWEIPVAGGEGRSIAYFPGVI